MLIKSADDKSRRLKLLQELQRSDRLNAHQRNWLKDELTRQQRGMDGERDAAFYIDSWKKDSDRHAILHDLRLVVDGEVAQIDHLVINRAQRFLLFETKCFNGQLHINDRGEFSVEYPGERLFGVPSPLEQSRRHERILAKLLERLDITGRAGQAPTFHHVVLLHPKAIIHRPKPEQFDTRDVIKADMIARWHDEHVESLSATQVLGMALNLRSQDTLKSTAEKLTRQHRPADVLQLPEFMKPKPAAEAPAGPVVSATPAAASSAESHPLYRKLICANCQAKITYAEGKYCWSQERRFEGLQFCRICQASRI